MTAILFRTHSSNAAIVPSSLALLEPAVSSETRDIAHRVQALRSGLSPAFIRPQAGSASRDASLQERLFGALAAAKILTSQVAMHLDGEWRGKLFRQLDSLHDPAEWEQGDQPLQQASFATFLKAMLTINPERRPGLGLSQAGHLIAAWTKGGDRLTIEFLPNDRVRWVLSMHADDGIVRYAGDTPVSRLRGGLANHNPEHWFSHGTKNHEHS